MIKDNRFKKPGKCSVCNKAYKDVGFWALDKCRICYFQSRILKLEKPVRKNSAERYVKCLKCELEFGTFRENGKEVKKGSSGYCSSCYMKLYSSNEPRKCVNCNIEISRRMKSICRVCEEKLPTTQRGSKSKKNQYELWKSKSHIILETEQYELIRRLLARFQSKQEGYVDYLRVANIYVELFNQDTYLDACNEVEQVVIMLRRLKELWLDNKLKRERLKNNI